MLLASQRWRNALLRWQVARLLRLLRSRLLRRLRLRLQLALGLCCTRSKAMNAAMR